MPVNVALVLGAILAIAATIVLFIFVLPKSRDGKLPNKFLQFLHDALNFKILFLESILKALYVLFTCLSIFVGFFLLFSRIDYGYGYGYHSYYTSTFTQGLVMLILGPIVLRIVYELVMLTIILVRNVIEINRKMTNSPDSEAEAASQPEPVYLYCSQCGTRYDVTQGNCPNCGKNNTP